MQVKYNFIADGSGALWSLNIDWPYPMGRFPMLILNPDRRNIVLNMNGSHLDTAGRVTMDLNTGRNNYDAELYYELDDDGFTTDMKVTENLGRETVLKLDVDEGELKTFLLTHGYSREFAMRMYMGSRLPEVLFSVEYDGEQVIINQGSDVIVRCTGEFVSDHEYLITMTPEGENLADTTPAYIRVTREGEAGNWTLRGAVIYPADTEYASATLTVSPAEPVEPLSGADGLMMLTPELAGQLIGSMVND